MRIILACLTAASISAASIAEDDVDFRALAWLEGCWSGEGLGGVVSECWMSTGDGRMTGAFQMVSGGELQFSEMLMLGEVDGVAGYHVKHFDPDFTGWEEKDDQVSFAFIAARGTRAEFDGLTYELDADGVLTVSLRFAQGDGTTSIARFHMRRVR